jgi:signal transduction histidine kinase
MAEWRSSERPGQGQRGPVHASASPLNEARLMSWVAALAACAAWACWFIDGNAHLNTAWEDRGVPLMCAVYAVASVLLRVRPQWLDAIVGAGLGASGVYILGCLWVANLDTTPTGLYSLTSNAQFIPLIYIVAYVSMRRGATRLCWAHYLGLVGLYLYLYGPWNAPVTHPGAIINGHATFVLLVTHPCYIVSLHYITTLKGRLRATEREAHDSKERFLAMLSHEIRTPLQTMLGSIDLLALKTHGGPERRAIDRLRQAASQLETHLRDLTEFTRLENPDWPLQTADTDVGREVQDACEALVPQAQSRGLQLNCHISPEDRQALSQVHTSGPRVRQIVTNLLSNALKYTIEGQVDVSLSVPSDAPGHLRIEVRDTGIGIPAQARQKVFDAYVRLEDQRTRDMDGSGLGLAVVRRLVERMGGQIALRSEPDQGSCFTVDLPRLARQ